MHLPVMRDEVISFLDPESGEDFVDCTVGLGGHALAVLERTGPFGRVLGVDADPVILERLRRKVEDTDYGRRL
ncbi:MAG: 16S rRNA (cytosine(1402)-N(4))-methyltransferase, partial [Candidatus Bathyarchaeia archaeon]